MNNLLNNYQPYASYMPNYTNDIARNIYGQSYQPRSQINWVLGLTGAKSFPITPNNTILLMDSEQPQFYIKTADGNGICSLKTYKFEEVVETPQPSQPQPQIDTSMFITREEFNDALKGLAHMDKNKTQQQPLL